MNYDDALRYLYSFANYERVMPSTYTATSFSLDKARGLMSLLGHPERGFASIHVAGTKGKGSTARATQQILAAAGYRVGLYSSPHLHSFRERIRINDKLIAADDLAAIVSEFPALVADFERSYSTLGPPSTFELATALAFLYFTRQQVDWAVIEVGVGGRLDTTNVIQPALAVITSISIDHVKLLGDTIPLIAAEKAGIIKRGVPVISSPQVAEAAAVIQAKAKAERAPLALVGRQLQIEEGSVALQRVEGRRVPVGQQFRLEFRHNFPRQHAELQPLAVTIPLLGAHQRENVATAVGAAMLLTRAGVRLYFKDVQAGLAALDWPGRLEVLRDEPGAPLLICDGAHNGDSARRLAETISDQQLYPHRKLLLVVGTVEPHPADEIIAALAPAADVVIIARANHPRASDPARLLAAAEAHGQPQASRLIGGSVAQSLALAERQAGADDLICCTGSLFVVADAREAMGLAGAVDAVRA